MSKEKLKFLALHIFDTKKKRLLIFINSFKKINNIEKKNLIFIFTGRYKIQYCFFYFFCLIFKNIKFKKNFFLLYKFQNELKGNNILPNWPGIYLKNNFVTNLLLWLKKFLLFFILKNKLYAILIKVD